MQRVAVYCGVSGGKSDEYRSAAVELGSAIAARGLGLVYGSGGTGMMRAVADAAIEGGANVIGVIPAWMKKFELGHMGVTERIEVDSMHTRKAKMAELADGFIAMPGGLGTMEEVFEVLTWQQLELHTKPVAFLDVNGFWDHLFAFLDHAVGEGLLKPSNRAGALRFTDPAELLDRFQEWAPTEIDEWMIENRT